MGKLILASPEDVQNTRPRDLKKSVLLSPCLTGPPPSFVLPGQAPLSGTHYDAADGSILEQFPLEVLDKILVLVEPIWLFQLEQAVPSIASYLTSSKANRIWYQVLPVALYCSPESYQQEGPALWNRRSITENGGNEYAVGAFKITLDQQIRSQANAHPSQLTKRDNRTPRPAQGKQIGLPELSNCSSLADAADLSTSVDYSHRSGVTQYPLIKATRKGHAVYRVRNLALGGPYQPSLSYRREVLGNLHTQKRCDVCLCMLNPPKTVTVWAKVRLCDHCLDQWTIRQQAILGTDEVLDHINILLGDDNYRLDKVGKIWDVRAHVRVDRVFLPLIDHIVRDVIGTDYRTAKAKEYYLSRLRLLKNKETKVMTARRDVRLQIVVAAKRLLKPSNPDSFSFPRGLLKYWSETFLPDDRLHEVMFAPEDLDRAALLDPIGFGMKYPDDPTVDEIRTRHQAANAVLDDARIEGMAHSILNQLFRTPNKYSQLVDLATKYHLARLRATLTLEDVKQSSRKISQNPMQNAPFRASPSYQYTARFDSILAKLHLEPDNATKTLQVDMSFKQDALKTLPQILEFACVACPATGFLARPGIEGVVQHVRTAHASLFWGDPVFGSREEFFKIIG